MVSFCFIVATACCQENTYVMLKYTCLVSTSSRARWAVTYDRTRDGLRTSPTERPRIPAAYPPLLDICTTPVTPAQAGATADGTSIQTAGQRERRANPSIANPFLTLRKRPVRATLVIALPTKPPSPHRSNTLIHYDHPLSIQPTRRGRFQTCPANQTPPPTNTPSQPISVISGSDPSPVGRRGHLTFIPHL